MNNFNRLNFEQENNKAESSQISQELLEEYRKLDLKIISKFKPSNAELAKMEFLADGSLDAPNNRYDELNDQLDQDWQNFAVVQEYFTKNADNLGQIEREIYQNELDGKQKSLKMLEAARKLNFVELTLEEKMAAQKEFMQANIEAYGAPDETTFKSLINEKIAAIKVGDLDNKAKTLYDELIVMVGDEILDGQKTERFKPSQETIDWFKMAVETLYAEQLALVPETPTNGDKFQMPEVFDIFGAVLDNLKTYGLGEDTKVEWTDAGALSVTAEAIKIPRNRTAGNELSPDKLKSLVVHEVGTHFMRRQTGKEYGLGPLDSGLKGYTDTEEGIAKAMEMAMMGKYQEAGVDHYISAGLAFFGQKDFREVFDINWRLKVLTNKKVDVSDEAIKKARELAYDKTQRIFRGTNQLPWFKDLSYFNGAQEVWRFIEKNVGSEMLIDDLILGGKNDLFNKQQQSNLYELKVGKR